MAASTRSRSSAGSTKYVNVRRPATYTTGISSRYLGLEGRIAGDVDPHEVEAELGPCALQHRVGLVAQVAAGRRNHPHLDAHAAVA